MLLLLTQYHDRPHARRPLHHLWLAHCYISVYLFIGCLLYKAGAAPRPWSSEWRRSKKEREKRNGAQCVSKRSSEEVRKERGVVFTPSRHTPSGKCIFRNALQCDWPLFREKDETL